jgi:serine/threonine protein kinase
VLQTLYLFKNPEVYECEPGSPEHHLAVTELTRAAWRQYALAHGNIIRVLGVVEKEGMPWIVMELGVMPLNALLAGIRPPSGMPLPAVLRLTRDVLAALVHLHGQDPCLIHHDLSPANVVRVP